MKTEIVYGIHPVFEAIRAGRRDAFKVFVSVGDPSKRLAPVVQLAQGRGIPIETVDSGKLKALSGTGAHQGVCARVTPYPWGSWEELTEAVNHPGRRCLLLVLDHVVDPHNLGALVRTALCAGVDGVIMAKDRSAPPSPAASKASAGALEHIRLVRVTNLVRSLKELKAHGVWVFGLDRQARQSLFSSDLTDSLAIIVGGEAKGIRPLVRSECDQLIAIPQVGDLNSLNASAAGAVVLYEAFRQRSQADI